MCSFVIHVHEDHARMILEWSIFIILHDVNDQEAEHELSQVNGVFIIFKFVTSCSLSFTNTATCTGQIGASILVLRWPLWMALRDKR